MGGFETTRFKKRVFRIWELRRYRKFLENLILSEARIEPESGPQLGWDNFLHRYRFPGKVPEHRVVLDFRNIHNLNLKRRRCLLKTFLRRLILVVHATSSLNVIEICCL